jgi:hypothetical protein
MPTFIDDDEFEQLVLDGVVRRTPKKDEPPQRAAAESQELSKLAKSIERAIITQASAMQALAEHRAAPQPIQITQKEAPHRRSTFTLTVTERDEDGQIVQVKIVEDQ